MKNAIVKTTEHGFEVAFLNKEAELEKYLNSLDDQLFLDASSRVQELTGRTLQEWSEQESIEENYKMFKNVVNTICAEKILYYSKYYN